jgi:O-antigen ligase
MGILLGLTAVLVIFLLGTSSTLGWHRVLYVTVLISLCLYPQLLTARRATYHVGMAPPTAEVRTFAIVIFAIALVALLSGGGRLRLPRSLLLLPIWLIIGMGLVWTDTAEHWSGVWQLAIGMGAWIAGSFLAYGAGQQVGFERLAARVLFFIVAIQIIVTVMQLFGVPINSLAASDALILDGRPNGTFNHPDNLGKGIVMLLVLVLPLTRSKDAVARRLAYSTMFLALIPLGIAQGRANFIGAILIVVVWTVLLPKSESINVRACVLLATAALGAAFLGVIVSRFVEDPTGGVRTQLTTYALQQIPRSPIFGVGPNGYTTVVAPLTGSNIPVHNTYLLAAAELGIPGALCLLAPFLAVTIRAWRVRREESADGDYGRALVALVPALILIGLTGWGLLGSAIWPLWCFVTSFCATNVIGSRHILRGRNGKIPASSAGSLRGSVVQREEECDLLRV